MGEPTGVIRVRVRILSERCLLTGRLSWGRLGSPREEALELGELREGLQVTRA